MLKAFVLSLCCSLVPLLAVSIQEGYLSLQERSCHQQICQRKWQLFSPSLRSSLDRPMCIKFLPDSLESFFSYLKTFDKHTAANVFPISPTNPHHFLVLASGDTLMQLFPKKNQSVVYVLTPCPMVYGKSCFNSHTNELQLRLLQDPDQPTIVKQIDFLAHGEDKLALPLKQLDEKSNVLDLLFHVSHFAVVLTENAIQSHLNSSGELRLYLSDDKQTYIPVPLKKFKTLCRHFRTSLVPFEFAKHIARRQKPTRSKNEENKLSYFDNYNTVKGDDDNQKSEAAQVANTTGIKNEPTVPIHQKKWFVIAIVALSTSVAVAIIIGIFFMVQSKFERVPSPMTRHASSCVL